VSPPSWRIPFFGNAPIEEAIAHLKEATELYLEEFPGQKFSKPFLTTFEASISG